MSNAHPIAYGSGKFFECFRCNTDSHSVLVWCWQCPEPVAYKCLQCRTEWRTPADQ